MTRSSQRTRQPSLPGEILAELYLVPHEVSIARFAEACGVSRKHMSAIVKRPCGDHRGDGDEDGSGARYHGSILAEFTERGRSV